ncbi:MAG: histidinol-phosphate transaminase [Lachnospiraceae bacterium]|nr:histidinol-phosphate transaminase [Lachnospiraceae bacterium]
MSTWEDKIRTVVPYVPGEQPKFPGMIKLNTNENPYPPAPGVQKRLKEMEAGMLKLYSDPTASELVNALAEAYELPADQIFVGVGSDDVLSMSFLTFFNSDKPILFPDITYSFYDVWADLYRIPYRCPALDENFRIRKEDYYGDNGGIVIANPNAPTSICEEPDVIEDIIRNNPNCVVIVDEAYIDFGGTSVRPLIDKYENLLVVQTFSKSRSLAGLRIGFAMGSKKLIAALSDVKYSFNSYTMNYPSIVLGAEAVRDREYFIETTQKVIRTREETKPALAKLGFHFPDSRTNFIFAAHESVPAKEIFAALRKENIFVRYFDKPRIDNYLRISVGTDEQMKKLLAFLETYLSEKHA